MLHERCYYGLKVMNRRVEINCLVRIWYTVYELGSCCRLHVVLSDTAFDMHKEP